jgi:hypothetical protein
VDGALRRRRVRYPSASALSRPETERRTISTLDDWTGALCAELDLTQT